MRTITARKPFPRGTVSRCTPFHDAVRRVPSPGKRKLKAGCPHPASLDVNEAVSRRASSGSPPMDSGSPTGMHSSRPLRSRRKYAKTGMEWHPLSVPLPLCVFASWREPIRALCALRGSYTLPCPTTKGINECAGCGTTCPISPAPSSRAPFLSETHFHTETPSPPRLEYPSSEPSSVCSAARCETDLPIIPEGWEPIASGRARHAPVHGRALAGSVPRQGFKDRKFSTKDTNDTKPTHATVIQAVAPGPEGRQMLAHRVSSGFRPPHNHTAPAGATESLSPWPAPIVRFVIHASMDMVFDNVHAPGSRSPTAPRTGSNVNSTDLPHYPPDQSCCNYPAVLFCVSSVCDFERTSWVAVAYRRPRTNPRPRYRWIRRK